MTAESTHATAGPQGPARESIQAAGASRREGATIGASTRINGELQADEDLLIEGGFTGTLVLRKHQLSIGAQGQIKGTAYANTVTVDGQIEGDLYAAERISIRKGARVKGNIFSPRVSLEDGAVLRGSVEMDPEAIQEAVKSKFGEAEKAARPVESKPATPAVAPRPAAQPAETGKGPEAKPDAGRPGYRPEAVAAANK